MAATFYEILGISPTASQEEIKTAFKKKARESHPDVNQEDPDAAEKFAEVTHAYNVLSDPETRKLYDLKGESPEDFNVDVTAKDILSSKFMTIANTLTVGGDPTSPVRIGQINPFNILGDQLRSEARTINQNIQSATIMIERLHNIKDRVSHKVYVGGSSPIEIDLHNHIIKCELGLQSLYRDRKVNATMLKMVEDYLYKLDLELTGGVNKGSNLTGGALNLRSNARL